MRRVPSSNMAAVRDPSPVPVTDHDKLKSIVRRLEAVDLTPRMVSTFRGSIDSYARLPEEMVLGQISEIVTGNVELFARTVLEGRAPLSSELEAFRSSARVRAAEGMQLEDLLHAYRVGG